ncbi:MAG: PSD1 and planctomycete cytochrome C domain-containing protein [Pirellulales bacterium]
MCQFDWFAPRLREMAGTVAAVHLLFLWGTAPLVAADPARTDAKIVFARDVQPILAEHCHKCHGPGKRESNFRLDDREVAFAGGDFGEPPIVPGDAEASPLIWYVSGEDESLVMPPEGERLTAAEVSTLRRWIDQGADWPDSADTDVSNVPVTDHWSFQPLTHPDLPPRTAAAENLKNPIDAFLQRKLLEAGLAPSPPADRITLIRRLYLVMHGLPPTPDQVDRFVNDTRPDAYDRLVERILDSPRYGERWARHWLDVVRFAETNGFETNTPRDSAWHYRDYVIRAFNEDLPYDRFVFEQVAGDTVGADAATGFIVGGAYDVVKSPDPGLTMQQRQDELADMINTTSTAFLGLTVGCARCHNHKFDPILQKDYYAMQAVFAGVQHGERPLREQLSPEDIHRRAMLRNRLADVDQQLSKYEPPASFGDVIVLDDGAASRVTLHKPQAGQGVHPAGVDVGFADDLGDAGRLPNVSDGRYTWWENTSGEDLISYQPGVTGRWRIWLSWGRGFDTHDPRAQYVLDADGDLATRDDQQEVAVVDQQLDAAGSGEIVDTPLWSGFYDAGAFELHPGSRLALRGSTPGAAVTADVVVLERADDRADGIATSIPPLRPPVHTSRNVDRFPPIEAKYVRLHISATNASEPCLDELEIYSTGSADEPPRNVALVSAGAVATSSGDYQGDPKHQLGHVNDGRYGNAWSWISNENGRGWVQIELPQAQRIERIVWGRDRQERYADRLAIEYVIDVATEPDRWTVVASSEDRAPYRAQRAPLAGYRFASRSAAIDEDELARLIDLREELSAQLPDQEQHMVYAGSFTPPGLTYRLYRGDPTAPREQVSPDGLSVLVDLPLPADAPEQERRVALARWIVDPANPLTARVMVNRIWHCHFGHGIVDTPSDFGANGARPSHPELLDWLAVEFIRSGWSVKHMHRLIMRAAAYRQSSAPRDEALAIDADSRLLWRFPPRRLEAEPIRDSVLQVTGMLRTEMGGPGYSVFQPNENYVRVYVPKVFYGPAEWRRMIYMTKVRMEQDAVFGAFDCPDAGQVAPERNRSTTPLQALNLFNSDFVLQQADLLAQRLRRDAPDDPPGQVRRAFQLLVARVPEPEEVGAAISVIDKHGLPAFCRAVLNTSEFLFIP